MNKHNRIELTGYPEGALTIDNQLIKTASSVDGNNIVFMTDGTKFNCHPVVSSIWDIDSNKSVKLECPVWPIRFEI